MIEQDGDEQTAHALEFRGIAGTHNPFEVNFTITTEAAKKEKNRGRKQNKNFMQNSQASGISGRNSRAKTTYNRNNAVATPDSQKRIEFEKKKKAKRYNYEL